MTAVATPIDDEVVAAHLPRAVVPIAVRWVVLVGAAAVGFSSLAIAIARQVEHGDPLWYLVDAPVWGVVAASGIQARRRRELPIHDRQVDWIVATGVAVLLGLIETLLQPRIATIAPLVVMNVVALALFLFGASLLLFGSRPTKRFWAAWLLLFACWPLPFRVAATLAGGAPQAAALLAVAYGTAAAVIAAGPRLRAAVFGGGVAVLTGVVAVVALEHRDPRVLEALPGAVAATVAAVAVALERRRHDGSRPPGAARPLAYPRASPLTVCAVAAAGL